MAACGTGPPVGKTLEVYGLAVLDGGKGRDCKVGEEEGESDRGVEALGEGLVGDSNDGHNGQPTLVCSPASVRHGPNDRKRRRGSRVDIGGKPIGLGDSGGRSPGVVFINGGSRIQGDWGREGWEQGVAGGAEKVRDARAEALKVSFCFFGVLVDCINWVIEALRGWCSVLT